MKKFVTVLLALCMLTAVLAGCGKEDQTPTATQNQSGTAGTAGADAAETLPGGQILYSVTVTDALGAPAADVIVRFMQNGTQVSMNTVDAQGVASKAMDPGTYEVELQFMNSELSAYYDTTDLTVTAQAPSKTVILYQKVTETAGSVYAYSILEDQKKDCETYAVKAGASYVPLVAGERNYFKFTPTESGQYAFYMLDGDGEVGYFGAPHFVQDQNAGTAGEKGVTVNVKDSMISTDATSGTTVLVIGVDAGADQTSGILMVERLGDALKDLSDEPWTPMETTHTPSAFTLTETGTLTYVDIYETDSTKYTAVKGEDGYYHLNTATGPILYVDLGKESPVISLQVIIQGDGSLGGAPIRKYFYDENKEFVKKEDYTEILITYFENMDQDKGVYPLNDDLIYIIQQGCAGWWDAESNDYIFDGCNPELGWMFAVCYLR